MTDGRAKYVQETEQQIANSETMAEAVRNGLWVGQSLNPTPSDIEAVASHYEAIAQSYREILERIKSN